MVLIPVIINSFFVLVYLFSPAEAWATPGCERNVSGHPVGPTWTPLVLKPSVENDLW